MEDPEIVKMLIKRDERIKELQQEVTTLKEQSEKLRGGLEAGLPEKLRQFLKDNS